MFNLYTYEKQKALEEKRLKEKNDLLKIQENRKSKLIFYITLSRKRKKISLQLHDPYKKLFIQNVRIPKNIKRFKQKLFYLQFS
jgi:hypothetical protein